jgi:serine/threonine protein kinase
VLGLKSYNKQQLLGGHEQMVHNEINSLAVLRSPHIMRLYEVVDEYSKVHLVIELCPGVAMHHLLKKGPLSAQSC